MDGFEAELQYIDKAARLHLPALNAVYTTAANLGAGTSSVDGNVAADPPVCRNGGAFGKQWQELREQIVSVLNTCAWNATKIEVGLGHVVDTYAANDAKIAADMNSLTQSFAQKN
ncbi:MAG TPA: hypothetical protein VG756_33010 [Pseudonocardiaceae bacterium]|jgi:hypothetical protein|nr:hypothetical protein [Pseudonocardiaceae bacterium]